MTGMLSGSSPINKRKESELSRGQMLKMAVNKIVQKNFEKQQSLRQRKRKGTVMNIAKGNGIDPEDKKRLLSSGGKGEVQAFRKLKTLDDNRFRSDVDIDEFSLVGGDLGQQFNNLMEQFDKTIEKNKVRAFLGFYFLENEAEFLGLQSAL